MPELEFSIQVIVILSAVAFLAGFVDSVAGGGGLISLPGMILLGIPEHYTLGTNKFMCSPGALASLITYIRSGNVVWSIVIAGTVFSLAGSAYGASLILRIDQNLVGRIVLILTPLALFFSLFPKKDELRLKPNGLAFYILTVLICFIIGVYDGFFGPGTGSFLIIAFNLVLGMGLTFCAATAKALNLASNLSALVVFLAGGKVLYSLGVPMALANVLGNIAGSRMAVRGGAKVVKRMLTLSLCLLLCTLAYHYLWR